MEEETSMKINNSVWSFSNLRHFTSVPHWLKYSPVGFTLIELLVVIAIIGVLAAVLIAVLDPLDKIASSNDTGVLSVMKQVGNANDAYAVNHSNAFASSGNGASAAVRFDNALASLNTAGEVKFSSLSEPSVSYIYGYNTASGSPPVADNTCTTACTGYALFVQLKSKKYTSGNTGSNVSFYLFKDGKACTLLNQAALPVAYNSASCP